MTQKEVENWADEPQEYIYSENDKFDDFSTTR